MQQAAIDIALSAMEKFQSEKDIALFIASEFDKSYTPTWHCVVGHSFGTYLTHEDKDYIHFFLNQYGIMLFKI